MSERPLPTPPATLADFLGHPLYACGARRAVLVANNPRLTARLELNADDLLVQFNRPLFAQTLRAAPCARALCFFANHHESYWGFGPDLRPGFDLAAEAGGALHLLFAPVWRPGLEEGLRAALGARRSGVTASVLDGARLPGLSYPQGRMPSLGFAVLGLLRLLNLLRRLHGREAMALATVGFTGAADPGAWVRGRFEGHDFAHEQAVLATLPEVERL